jgi:hypothetical protein
MNVRIEDSCRGACALVLAQNNWPVELMPPGLYNIRATRSFDIIWSTFKYVTRFKLRVSHNILPSVNWQE